MVTMKVRQWVVIDNVHHIKTSWQIATDNEFENLVAESIENDNDITTWDSGVSVPVDGVLWGRVNRHFDDDTSSGWSEPRKLLNISNHNSLLLLNDVTVERPILRVNKLEVVGDSEVINVATTKFKCTNDGHFSTHWIVTDANGSILYKSLEDTENKDSISIKKSDFALEISRYDRLIFSAIHKSGGGIESAVGQLVIDTSSFNFEFLNKMKRVLPLNVYTLKFKKIDVYKPHRIDNIKIIRSSDDEVIHNIVVNDDSLNFDIPGALLLGDNQFYIDIYAIDNNGMMNIKRGVLKTIAGSALYNIDRGFVYDNNFKLLTQTTKRSIPKGLVSDELYDGTVLVPVGKELRVKKFDNYKKAFSDIGVIAGVSLLTDNNDYTLVKRHRDKIIIDTMNSDGKPTFLIYTYDQFKEMATLEYSHTRESEITPIGKYNAVVVIDENLYYVPVGTSILNKLSLTDGAITKIRDIDLPDSTSTVMVNLNNGKLLFIGGDSVFGVVYDINENYFYSRYDIPISFRSRELKTMTLVNGDTVVYRTTVIQDDSAGDVLVFDYDTKRMQEREYSFDPIGLEAAIRLSSGSIVFVASEDEKELLYLFN